MSMSPSAQKPRAGPDRAAVGSAAVAVKSVNDSGHTIVMVKLAEWRGKEIFRKYGVPLPKGRVARSPHEAIELVQRGEVPLPCVVKAQVLAGGRGKGGAVRFASTVDEVRQAAEGILALEFKGERVRELLLEEKLPIARELYLSLTLDRSRRLPLLMTNPKGGV